MDNYCYYLCPVLPAGIFSNEIVLNQVISLNLKAHSLMKKNKAKQSKLHKTISRDENMQGRKDNGN